MEPGAVVTPPSVAGPLTLHPFRAITLSPSRVGDPASPRIFGRPTAGVPERIREWERRGQLTHDSTPALYLHEYTAGGLTVRGVVGALDVAHRTTSPEERCVLPHEGIHPRQADELADRMERMWVNPAPILLVQHSPSDAKAVLGEVTSRLPDRAFGDKGGQRHRIWAIREPAQVAAWSRAVGGSRALIADGHHRYAAYLRLQDRHSSTPADRGLAMLIDQDDTPLFLGAIHRVLAGVPLPDLRAACDRAGATWASCSRGDALDRLGPASLAVSDSREWASVTVRVRPDRAAVEVLHDEILPALPRTPRAVDFHHTVGEALGSTTEADTAVLLAAPSVDLILRIAVRGRLLPEKATSFQPKPNLGVLIRSLSDEASAHP